MCNMLLVFLLVLGVLPFATAEEECTTDQRGLEYKGTTSVTKTGSTCLAWNDENSNNPFDASMFPDDTLEEASNYCRNPDGDSGVWCYVDDPMEEYEYCDIPLCDTQAATTPSTAPAATTPATAVATPAEQVLILLDVSDSLNKFVGEISGFLATFYSLTSTDAFFQNHKRKVTVATFNEGLVSGEQWVLDYSLYNIAADLRDAEDTEVNDIVSTINSKEASGFTNIGKTLQEALDTFMMNQNWRVILVSDFINMRDTPDIIGVLQQYSQIGIKIVPVIVDKPIRDESTYSDVQANSVDYGIDLSQGLDGGGVAAIYTM